MKLKLKSVKTLVVFLVLYLSLLLFSYKPIQAQVDSPYTMRVLVLKYFPLTSDGANIDISVTGDVGGSYNTVRTHTINVTNNLIAKLSQATKYKGYQNIDVTPSLTYQVYETREFTTAVPIDNQRRPKYNTIMRENDICNFVENYNVGEVWMWAYQGPTYPGSTYPYLNISESKMSGPYGDISNSYRLNDMPRCSKTYRVYTFNYGRGTSEAVESWGHQLEAELMAVDRNGLFHNRFQGQNYPQTLGVTGRCGSVHNPPNARHEYDRNNLNPQQSDCLDWNPNGLGTLSDISCSNWGCGASSDSNNADLNYQIWNWQNLPGLNNDKTFNGNRLRNWWDVHGDFDNVMGNSRSLIDLNSTPIPFVTPTPTIIPTQIPTPSPLNGDANGDNLVNETDYSIWHLHFGQQVSGVENGDFNNDSRIDGIDYSIWMANFVM